MQFTDGGHNSVLDMMTYQNHNAIQSVVVFLNSRFNNLKTLRYRKNQMLKNNVQIFKVVF